MNCQCLVSFQICKYKDEVLCDVAPMKAGYIFLGGPWKFDKHAIHDDFTNKYSFIMNKKSIVLVPLTHQEVCLEHKLLKQEFEKRLKGEEKESKESEGEKKSATNKEREKKVMVAESPMSVTEIKQDYAKKKRDNW